jgi:hypothetical protein
MSIDAVALLPPIADGDQPRAGSWSSDAGPEGGTGAWRQLADGILLNLGFPMETPDADLYDVARRWMHDLPERLWVLPDAAVPDGDTAEEIRAATAGVGRWISAGSRRQTVFGELGFSAEEEAALQRDLNSGDPDRVARAGAAVEERSRDVDPAKMQALLARARAAT